MLSQTLTSVQHYKTNSHKHPVKRVLWQILALNLLVAAAKIVAGTISGSISMIADGFHSATDGASNVIGLVGLSLAGRPPDHNHPYGHQKYETFATLGIGLLLIFTSANVLKSIFNRIIEGNTPEITALSFGVMLGTIALNIGVTLYEKYQAKQQNSPILQADAAHTQSDILVSLSVLVSLVAVKAGWLWLDAVMALAIVGVIGSTGYKIVRRAGDILADSAAIDPVQVAAVALSVAGVQSCHKIRSRGEYQAAHLDLHIQVDGSMSLEDAHHLGHITQNRLIKKFGIQDVLVHVEPA